MSTAPVATAVAFTRTGSTISLDVTGQGAAERPASLIDGIDRCAVKVTAPPEQAPAVLVEVTLAAGTVHLRLPGTSLPLGPLERLVEDARSLDSDPADLSTVPVLAEVARCLLAADYGLTASSSAEEVRDVVQWAASGWGPEEMQAGLAVGLTSDEVWLWSGYEGGSAAAILDWWCVGDPDYAERRDRRFWYTQWLDIGITSPVLHDKGLRPQDAEFMREAGIPVEQGWPLWDRQVCPAVAAAGYRQGRTFEQVERFAALLRRSGARWCTHKTVVDPNARCGWNEESSVQVAETLRSMRGLDLDDVMACIEAGMSPKRARQHVRAGREMGPVRLLSALADRPTG